MQFSVFLFAPLLVNFLALSPLDAMIYWNIISFILGLIIILLLMRRDLQAPVREDAADTGGIILWSIGGFFLALASQIIAVNIEVNLLNIESGSENTAIIMEIARQTPLFIIIPAIIAPIIEELIFRKIIFGTFYKRMNFFVAAIASSLIFGIIHMELEHLLIYTSMGFVFAYIYVRTKRIIVPIIVHMALNTMSVIAQFSIDPEDIEQLQLKMIFFGG